MKDKDSKPYTIISPLEAWPGKITLPDPDHFDGLMWQEWRKAISETEADEVNRLYCYAGLRLIATIGKWEIPGVDLAQIRGWEKRPADERIKLVSWVGREVRRYIDGQLLDPTE